MLNEYKLLARRNFILFRQKKCILIVEKYLSGEFLVRICYRTAMIACAYWDIITITAITIIIIVIVSTVHYRPVVTNNIANYY